MSTRNPQNVLARFSPGRTDDIEKIYLHAVSGSEPFVLSVEGPPGAGTSETLRAVFDRLFLDQRFVVPFYFSFTLTDGDARTAAARHLYDFLLQAIAFRRRTPELIAASPDICELRELAPLPDAEWVARLCEECSDPGPLNDDRAFIRAALAAPLRAAANFRVCLIIDDIHAITSLRDGDILLGELRSLADKSQVPLIVGTHRRFRHGITLHRTHRIGPLSFEDSAIFIDEMARSLDVTIADAARDLLAVQTEGRLDFARAIVSASRSRGNDLPDFRSVQKVYTQQLTSGAIGGHFDSVFADASPDLSVRAKLIDQLNSAVRASAGHFPLAALRERLAVGQAEFEHLIAVLESEEVLTVEGDRAAV